MNFSATIGSQESREDILKVVSIEQFRNLLVSPFKKCQAELVEAGFNKLSLTPVIEIIK